MTRPMSTKANLDLQILQIPKQPQPNHSAQTVNMQRIRDPVRQTTQLVLTVRYQRPAKMMGLLLYPEGQFALKMVNAALRNRRIPTVLTSDSGNFIPKAHPISISFFRISLSEANAVSTIDDLVAKMPANATYRFDTRRISLIKRQVPLQIDWLPQHQTSDVSLQCPSEKKMR